MSTSTVGRRSGGRLSSETELNDDGYCEAVATATATSDRRSRKSSPTSPPNDAKLSTPGRRRRSSSTFDGRATFLFVFSCLAIVISGGLSLGVAEEDVLQLQCSRQCQQNDSITADVTQVGLSPAGRIVNCDNSCKISQCEVGCGLWQRSLNSTCQKLCEDPTAGGGRSQTSPPSLLAPSGTKSFVEELAAHMRCVMGCNFATLAYVAQVRADVGGRAPGPRVLPGSATNVSVGVQWTTSVLPSVRYVVQFRRRRPTDDEASDSDGDGDGGERGGGGRRGAGDARRFDDGDDDLSEDGDYASRQSPSNRGTTASEDVGWEYFRSGGGEGVFASSPVTVEGLHPYTLYEFRVGWVVVPRERAGDAVVWSRPSAAFRTLPYGKPGSPPVVESAAAVDSTKISVSWSPPDLPNGEILAYSLTIHGLEVNGAGKEDGGPSSMIKELDANSKRQHIFSNLRPNSTYSVRISASNHLGAGPWASVVVQTLPPVNDKSTESPYLIFTSRGIIYLQDALEVWSDPYILHESKNKDPSYGYFDVDMDTRTGAYFVSDTDGVVYSASVTSQGISPPTRILDPGRLGGRAGRLSVDWLSKELYVLSGPPSPSPSPSSSSSLTPQHRWQIWRSGYDGKTELTAVVRDFGARIPRYLRVDPYFGYLYWVETSAQEDVSYLRRVDLHDVRSARDGFPASKAEVLLSGPSLGPFVVHHANFSLLVVDGSRNKTVLEVPFDGSPARNIRSPDLVIKSAFENVTDICFFAGRFFWTTPEEVYYEDGDGSKLSHNPFVFPSSVVLGADDPQQQQGATRNDGPDFEGVALYHPSAQPVPTPHRPPRDVEVLFGSTSARISWRPPLPSDIYGRGAWADWRYEISFVSQTSNAISATSNLKTFSYFTDKLRPNTTYSFKVRAFSVDGGFGPWSPDFFGSTLPDEKLVPAPKYIFTSDKGLAVSDPFGRAEVVPAIQFQEFSQGFPLTSMEAFGHDKLLLSMNKSDLVWFDLSSRTVTPLKQIVAATVMAVDWVGEKVYWSNPTQQIICRSNLDGGDTEYLPMTAIVQFMAVDSLRGFIYYSTISGVESATLNGSEPFTYFSEDIYSGERVVGMALNFDGGLIHWMVRSSHGVTFHQAPLRGATQDQHSSDGQLTESLKPRLTKVLRGETAIGPLAYFDGKLMWLESEEAAVVADITTQYRSRLRIRPKNGGDFGKLGTFAVYHPGSRRLPDGFLTGKKIKAVPNAVSPSSVRFVEKAGDDGESQILSLVWEADRKVNFGTVSYELLIDVRGMGRFNEVITGRTEYVFKREMTPPPAAETQLTITAFTMWGRSRETFVELVTPENYPDAPTNLRLFRIPNKPILNSFPMDQNANVVPMLLRWDPPSNPNGVLKGYRVWKRDSSTSSSSSSSPPSRRTQKENVGRTRVGGRTNETELRFDLNLDLAAKAAAAGVVYFEVEASNSRGGNFSTPLAVSVGTSGVDVPELPLVVAAAADSVEVMDLESGKPFKTLLSKLRAWPEVVAVAVEDNVTFCADGDWYIYIDHQQLAKRQAKASAMTVDWLGKFLYWAEVAKDVRQSGVSATIHRIDLSSNGGDGFQVETLVDSRARLGKVQSLGFNPFRSELILAEDQPDGFPRLFKIAVNENREVKPFFTSSKSNAAADRDECTCRRFAVTSERATVSSGPFTLNFSSAASDGRSFVDDSAVGSVIFYDERSDEILRADPSGCRCDMIFSFANSSRRGKDHAPRAFAVIDDVVYWFSVDSLFSVKLDDKKELHERTLYSSKSEPIFNHNNVLLSLNQPEPDSVVTCLKPKPYDAVPTLNAVTPVKLSVKLEAPKFPTDGCLPRLSRPTSYFHLCYWPVRSPSGNRTSKNNPGGVQELSEGTQKGAKNGNETAAMKSEPVCLFKPAKMDSPVYVELRGLQPTTFYAVHVSVHNHYEPEGPESDLRMIKTFRTSGFRPHKLDPPIILTQASSGFVNVRWESVRGAIAVPNPPQANYILEGRPVSALGQHWSVIYKGSETSFNFTHNRPQVDSNEPPSAKPNLTSNEVDPSLVVVKDAQDWVFRVAAENEFGLSDFSEPSKTLHEAEPLTLLTEGEHLAILVAVGCVGTFVLLLAAYGCFLIKQRNHLKARQFLTGHSSGFNGSGAGGVDLATLSDLPRNGRFVEEANELYRPSNDLDDSRAPGSADGDMAAPTAEEMALLPKIRRQHITLTKFLGSGAFGEVFEGLAKGVPGHSDPDGVKVAVKALRKNASAQERSEFLSEASRMLQFKHEHILRLLSVCVEGEPYYLVLELMDGGDLLSHLRSNRPTTHSASNLSLYDLMSMCVDVAKGCRYLEEIHFVHRDLAARNCLVTSRHNARCVPRLVLEPPHDQLAAPTPAPGVGGRRPPHHHPRVGSDGAAVVAAAGSVDSLDASASSATSTAPAAPSSTLNYITDLERDEADDDEPEELRPNFVVKIGDFGLARDVYKNDYYRKDGEGLLPVRWMPPESLADGVFTTQSDVWSFGVLLWEILTLGQQPYQARGNMEVFHFVRAGGRLTKPDICPDAMFDLMCKCWSYDAEDRPSFRDCLDHLVALKKKLQGLWDETVAHSHGFEAARRHEMRDIVFSRIQYHPLRSHRNVVASYAAVAPETGAENYAFQFHEELDCRFTECWPDSDSGTSWRSSGAGSSVGGPSTAWTRDSSRTLRAGGGSSGAASPAAAATTNDGPASSSSPASAADPANVLVSLGAAAALGSDPAHEGRRVRQQQQQPPPSGYMVPAQREVHRMARPSNNGGGGEDPTGNRTSLPKYLELLPPELPNLEGYEVPFRFKPPASTDSGAVMEADSPEGTPDLIRLYANGERHCWRATGVAPGSSASAAAGGPRPVTAPPGLVMVVGSDAAGQTAAPRTDKVADRDSLMASDEPATTSGSDAEDSSSSSSSSTAGGDRQPSSITPLYARPRPRRPRLPPNFPVSSYANVQPLPFMGKESVC